MHLHFKVLSKEHLIDILSLQNIINADLEKENKQHFIVPHNHSYYLQALNADNHKIIGIFDHDRLIAQAMISFPNSTDSPREMNEFLPNVSAEHISIYKAIFVHPDYRHHKLMYQMLEACDILSAQKGRTTVIAQIATENIASWKSFLNHGLTITEEGHDPSDGVAVKYMHKVLSASNEKTLHPKCIRRANVPIKNLPYFTNTKV